VAFLVRMGVDKAKAVALTKAKASEMIASLIGERANGDDDTSGPPTKKQLDFLKALGDKRRPPTKRAASRMIDERLAQRRRA
jgi:hypothetical protein